MRRSSAPPSDARFVLLERTVVECFGTSINGQLRKMLMVVKMRRSAHGIDMWEYAITPHGLQIGEPLRGYRGLTTSVPGPWSPEAGLPELVPEPQSKRPTRKSGKRNSR